MKSMSHRLRRFLPAESRPAFMRMATFGKIFYFICRKICLHEWLKSFKWFPFYARVNLTSRGGTLFSEAGDLKKHWKWQENEQHVHAPPCQPMHLTLSRFLKVHIKSQEDISILFNSNKHSVEVHKVASVNVSYCVTPISDLNHPFCFCIFYLFFFAFCRRNMSERKQRQWLSRFSLIWSRRVQRSRRCSRTSSPSSPIKAAQLRRRSILILQMERQQLPVKRQHSAKKTPHSGQCPSIGFSHLCEETWAVASLEFEFND